MADVSISWTPGTLELGDLGRQVAEKILPEVASDVTSQAFRWSFAYRLWRHTGQLTASIGYDIGVDGDGYYADVGGIWYARFLDPKARQLHFLRPLFPSALDVINGRQY